MLVFFGDSPVLLALIALMPAAISWWSGRRLLAVIDDPILPERMIANQRRNSVAFIIAFAGLASISPRSLVWTGPLVFLGTHAAAYPMRQAIFGETWSLGTYLSFFMRLLAGLFGFWAVLAGLPALSRMAGTADWLVAAAVGSVLLLWNARYADTVRYCLRTTPLEDPELLARCRQLAEQCALPQPRFETIPLRGGVLANALALPSLGTSSVLFTETLLARLDAREIAAICAHELAHLEHYNPRRLGQLNAVTVAIIFIGALWSPVLRLVGLSGSTLTTLIWLLLLTGALVLRARGKQQQETVCDVRAVELTGDPEPLIGALTKLYTIARIPRRVELRHEQADSHPSLARRIKDIRRAAGAAPAHLESAAVFTGSDGRTSVTFDQATLGWTGADAVTHSVEYTNLSELRIDATRASGPRLVARSTQSTAWEMPLAREDVVRMQQVLDQVDSRLGEPPVAAAVPQKFSRPGIGFVALIALILGQVSVAIIALLACVRMAAPLLAAAGLAAVTAAGARVPRLAVGAAPPDGGAHRSHRPRLVDDGVGVPKRGARQPARPDRRHRRDGGVCDRHADGNGPRRRPAAPGGAAERVGHGAAPRAGDGARPVTGARLAARRTGGGAGGRDADDRRLARLPRPLRTRSVPGGWTSHRVARGGRHDARAVRAAAGDVARPAVAERPADCRAPPVGVRCRDVHVPDRPRR